MYAKFLAVAVALLTAPQLTSGSGRRPIYNIYHMTNAIWQVDEGMELGANAIESDVTFDSNGTAVWFFHGVPCDCARWCERHEKVPAFLQYLRRTTNGGKYENNLALLFLDLKSTTLYADKKHDAGVDVANKLLNYLWLGVPIQKALNVLLCVHSVDDKELLWGAITTILRQRPEMIDKIGFDVSNNDDLEKIGKFYRKLGIEGHRWQGDGITNCLSYARPAGRMNSIVRNRDSDEESCYVDKAYQWTIDIWDQLRLSLRRNVDAIITNMPHRLASILKESEFRNRLRPANASDNPWSRYGCRHDCGRKPFISGHLLKGAGVPD
ncbi:hypothetical protein HPB51_017261 [Rhipicephalus microplus]|uniref:Uncharacterized protein n=1 Tax=Rhipicephalus microplus TaxID=6941 RepID=A0A9J6ETM3_RHIMP|nr:dermonecrotic toxin SPH-like [Rhipicephalus microplus]KAH8037761.1 hypothetical protein HPB51_017261 [Rhipicephalus microplus]